MSSNSNTLRETKSGQKMVALDASEVDFHLEEDDSGNLLENNEANKET
jgi:hypothetical protein